jgi:hypothetical protein
MPNPASVQFREIDLTTTVESLVRGVSFVLGETQRGPINNPFLVINSAEKFRRHYGGISGVSDFPLLCERALSYGAILRVSRVAHYDDITDESSLTATKASFALVQYIEFDGPLATGDVFDAIIDGNALTSTPFAVSNDNTLQLIASKIGDLTNVLNAWVLDTDPLNANSARRVAFASAGPTPLTVTGLSVTGGPYPITVTHDVSGYGVTDAFGRALFTVTSKYEGADYNNFVFTILDSSNRRPEYFNVRIQHINEPQLTENFINLIIPGLPTASESTYLDDIKISSDFLDITYYDLSSYSGQLRPANGTYRLQGGSDGDPITLTDYIGSASSKTGFHSFDEYDEALQIAVLEASDEQVHQAGEAYADSRKDLMYFGHIGGTLKLSADQYVSLVTNMGLSSSYTAIFGGGLKIIHPETLEDYNISELGDIIGIAARNDTEQAPWWSFSGPNRGILKNTKGVINNFGSSGQFNDLTLLTNVGLNMVVTRKDSRGVSQRVLWGNFTSQPNSSKLSFVNVRRLVIFIRKSLSPTLEKYLEEPNDPITWNRMYYEVQPFFEFLQSPQARALFEWRWEGDQFVSDLSQLKVNNAIDVGKGRYRVKLFITPIVSMQEIQMDLIIDYGAGVISLNEPS